MERRLRGFMAPLPGARRPLGSHGSPINPSEKRDFNPAQSAPITKAIECVIHDAAEKSGIADRGVLADVGKIFAGKFSTGLAVGPRTTPGPLRTYIMERRVGSHVAAHRTPTVSGSGSGN